MEIRLKGGMNRWADMQADRNMEMLLDGKIIYIF